MTEVRWERSELQRALDRGISDRWSDAHTGIEIRDDWLLCDVLRPISIYAPLEHPELAHQFAAVKDSASAVLAFCRAYGRLGWSELCTETTSRSAWTEENGSNSTRI